LDFDFRIPGTIISYSYETLTMKRNFNTIITPDFAMFLIGLEQKYQVAMDTILQVATKLGYNKGKIRGYFELQSFLKNKNIPTDQLNTQMLNKWFPA
jgi:hypothetical protein